MVGFTIYTLPRAWHGKPAYEQANALESWSRLVPRPQIILFGDDAGTAEAAERFGCVHAPGLPCNEHGTPYVNNVFHRANGLAGHDMMAFVNADIMLMQDWADALLACGQRFGRFCMVGQRLDIDIPGPLGFSDGWQGRLRARALEEGRYYTPAGSDYFGHKRGLYLCMPQFLIGRSSWDNWLMAWPLSQGLPLVNVTDVAVTVHPEVPDGKVSEWVSALPHHGEEIQYNRRLLAEAFGPQAGQTGQATWILGPDGFVKR